MKTRLDDVPALKVITAVVEAARYNRVRLALLRLGSPLRLALPDLRGLDMIMDERLWICVDRTLDDLPVLAWTEFETHGRRGLHEPVRCRLRFFHAHADDILEMVLDDVSLLLAERLVGNGGTGRGSVSRLRVRPKRR